jgi:carboxypeptidase T
MKSTVCFLSLLSLISLNFSVLALAGPTPSTKTYADVLKFMHDTAARYPEQAKLISLGVSDSGLAIEGLALGSGPINNLVVATHHGNEYGSTEVASAFAAHLAEYPILGQTIYVIPVLNITGYNAKQRWERVAGHFYDPNRDYPGPCGTDGPFLLKSTAHLARFVADHSIVTTATLHTHYPAVVYPWGISSHDLSTPYDGIFKMIAAAATVESKYPIGNSTELIYPADGTYEDFVYWKHGTWSLLFELGYSHTPTDSEISKMAKTNVIGLRRMFEQAPRQRADNHDFIGRCDSRLSILDLRDE